MPYTPQDLKGREHRCVVVFCSQGGCTATKLSFVGHVRGAREEFRAAGWGSGRFGWRCPAHKVWWKQAAS
jgi:hypothetical protein